MSLPTKWVDAIFDRLSIAYGRDFLGRWEGMPIALVKTDWSECLKGFLDQPECIAFALANLPDSKPPTAQEFRAICRQAPVPMRVMLPPPKVEDSLVIAQLRKMASEAFHTPKDESGNFDYRLWAKKLKAAHEQGVKLSLVQVNSYRTALRA